MRYSDVNLNRKTILITGGAGFIGSNLAFYFQEHHPDAKVVILDLFRSNMTLSNGNLKSFGHFKNLLGFRGEVISGDINDQGLLERLAQNYKFDYIFHEAAISDTTVLEQDLMIQTNVNAFKDLLDIAVAHGANMIYASSGATYGDAPSPQRVGCEAPQNVYGFSKLMMDHLGRQYAQKHTNISIVGLRYFNVYGPREFFKNKTASMVVQFGHQLLSGKNPKLFEELKKDGWIAFVSRQVYIFDDFKRCQKHQNYRWDKKLLSDKRYEFKELDLDDFSLFEKAEELYNELYLKKYSKHNVQFKAIYLQELVKKELLHLRLLYDNQENRYVAVVGIIG